MATATQVLSDPKFHALPEGERVKVMTQVDPNFGGLPKNAQSEVLTRAALSSGVGPPLPAPPQPAGITGEPSDEERLNKSGFLNVKDPGAGLFGQGYRKAKEGVIEMSRPTLDEKAEGLSKIVRGAGTAAAPVAIPFAVANPAGALTTAAGGLMGGAAAAVGASALGAGPGVSHLAEDAGGVAGGTLGQNPTVAAGMRGAAKGVYGAASNPKTLIGAGTAEYLGEHLGLPRGVPAAVVVGPRLVRSGIQGAKDAIAENAAPVAAPLPPRAQPQPPPIPIQKTLPAATLITPAPATPIRPPLQLEAPKAIITPPPQDASGVIPGWKPTILPNEKQPAISATPATADPAMLDGLAQSLVGKPFAKLKPDEKEAIETMATKVHAQRPPTPITPPAPRAPEPLPTSVYGIRDAAHFLGNRIGGADVPVPPAYLNQESTGVQIPQVSNARQAVAQTIASHLHKNGITAKSIGDLPEESKALFWNNTGMIPGASKQAHYSPSADTQQAVMDELRNLEKTNGKNKPAAPVAPTAGPLARNPKALELARQLAAQMGKE